MEAPHRSRSRTEAPSLLRSYRWQTVSQNGEKESELGPSHAARSSRHKGKLQRWMRAQSQPESELSEHSSEQAPPDGRASAKRSVFQRAFTTPTKMPKAQERSSKLSLRKYLRSMSHRKNQEATPRSDREMKEASKGKRWHIRTTL